MTSYNNPAFTEEVNVKPADEITTSNQDEITTSNHSSGPAKPVRPYKVGCCTVFWMILASVGLIMNIAMLAGGYQAMFDSIMKSQMNLKVGSATYDFWKKTPVPLLLYLNFYNITNPWEYQQGGKIKLDEVGPIVYKEYHEKQNVTFHDMNKTVSFMQERWWIYDDERSIIKEHDIITALNTIPISAAYSNKYSNIMLTGLGNSIKNVGEELIMNVTAGDLLFYGFTTPLLNLTTKWMDPDNLPPLPDIPDWLQDYLDRKNITLPPIDDIFADLFPPGLLDYDKFGWFYGRNHTLKYDGHWNMYTGEDGLDHLGDVGTWQYKNVSDFFPAPCNKITGSAGELFPPNLQPTFIQFWTPDLCMSVKLYFKEQYTHHSGLEVYRYFADNRTFSNGTTWPENECFCVHGTCSPEGLVNAESCRFGSPSFISYPHFYMADPWVKYNVEGVRDPDPDKDMFFIDMIPEIGVPTQVAARMQINMHVQPYKGELYCYRKNILGIPSLHKGPCDKKDDTEEEEYTYEEDYTDEEDDTGEDKIPKPIKKEITLGKIEMFENIQDQLVPLIWFEEVIEVPPEMTSLLKVLVFVIKSPVMTIIFSVSLVISLAILAGCSYRIYSGKKKAREAAF